MHMFLFTAINRTQSCTPFKSVASSHGFNLLNIAGPDLTSTDVLEILLSSNSVYIGTSTPEQFTVLSLVSALRRIYSQHIQLGYYICSNY